jgi:DNA invertase Pin-like site-specific DNA recombinase
MATAYYMRVSSKSQDTKSQEADMKAHAERESGAVWYRDKFTGKVVSRPGWDRLWADGLSRLFEELQARKVGLVSLRDGLDLNTAAGRLMAHVLASVAAYELEVKSERQLAGIEAVRAANGGACPWGGRKPGTRVKVTEEVERTIREMRHAGRSIAEIARVVQVTRPTIYATLKRDTSVASPS